MKIGLRIVVVGAGPAGIAAATAAARAAGPVGATVIVLDDNAAAGGQIWRGGVATRSDRDDQGKRAALAAFEASGAKLLAGRRVIDGGVTGWLSAYVESTGVTERIGWDRLILVTGARERFLPFPGWTLPGVFGAGGLQALVKGGYDVRGQRIVVAGTGPLLLAVANHLQADGAQIACVAEQVPLTSLLGFGTSLWRQPAKLFQGARYRASLGRVSFRTGCWVVAAEGRDRLEAVRLTNGAKTWTEPCSLLACGFHLVPNTELAALLGCRIEHGFVRVGASMQTSVPQVYCAGELSGIAGLNAALIEGRIAGLAAAGQPTVSFAGALAKEQAFSRRLTRAFALRDELKSLCAPETVVCRCEDVRYGQLHAQTALTCWTDAKLMTRCGMGPCQGRMCGPAVETLFGWTTSSVRPPLFPVPLAALCGDRGHADSITNELQEIV